MTKKKKSYSVPHRSRSDRYSWQRSRPRRRSGPSPWLIVGGVFALLFIVGIILWFFHVRSLTLTSQHPVSQPRPLRTATPTFLPASEAGGVITPDSTPAAFETPAPFDRLYLRQFMLDLVNADRAAAGLPSVAWDDTAAYAGQIHAEEMAAHGYLSHWDLEGNGPDYRYTHAGGLHAVQENVYSRVQRYEDGSAVPVTDWEAVIREAEAALMNSPEHRRNILNPAHTHVGIGLAYNNTNGEFRVAQEFVGHYVLLDPLPKQIALGSRVRLSGQVLTSVNELLLNLAYEPFPTSLDITELNATSAFQSPAEIYDSLLIAVSPDGRFNESIILDYEGRPGRYHIRLWVETEQGKIPATVFVLDVN